MTDIVPKITHTEYARFLEDYTWQLLQSPDYRLGQAFLNYFPKVSQDLARGGKEGTLLEMKLYYETDDARAKWLIEQWIDE